MTHRLNGRWTVVAPDAPAHGLTGWSGGSTYNFTQSVPGALFVLDQLVSAGVVGERVVVLGHSVGALVATRVAQARPQLVRHVIIEEPPRRPIRRNMVNGRHRDLIKNLQAMDQDARVQVAAGNPGWSQMDQVAWASSKAQVDARMFDVPTRWGPSLVRLVRQLRVPVTVVVGRRGLGSTTRPWRARRYRRADGAPVAVVELEAGHSPRRDDAVAFAMVVQSVLEDVDR